MRQIWISKPGPPEVLVVKEAPAFKPAPDKVRIHNGRGGVGIAAT